MSRLRRHTLMLTVQLSETKNELFHSRQKLAELQSQYRETLEDLHLHQDRIQELEMRSVGEIAGDHSLGDEMGGETDSLSDVRGTKTESVEPGVSSSAAS